MASVMECVTCHKESPPGTTWDEAPGWGILFGCLAVCSRECAEKFASEHSCYGCIPEGKLEFPTPGVVE